MLELAAGEGEAREDLCFARRTGAAL